MVTNKYMTVNVKKMRSLRKNLLVTLIYSPLEAFTLKYMTTQVIKRAEPDRALTISKRSLGSPPPPAEMAANTSGAPFPRARSVTPARDSEHDSFSEMASRAGERYKSAVEPRLYMARAKKINTSGRKK
jgi:hypothetical protein